MYGAPGTIRTCDRLVRSRAPEMPFTHYKTIRYADLISHKKHPPANFAIDFIELFFSYGKPVPPTFRRHKYFFCELGRRYCIIANRRYNRLHYKRHQ